MNHKGLDNLKHAIANDCVDRDCEIHNPDVALSEEVINFTHLAFYVAGAYWARKMIADEVEEMRQTIREESVNLAGIEYL